LDRRRGVAAADAGRAYDTNAGAARALEVFEQLLSPEHRAGQRVADADGQRRDIRLAFLNDIEMRVEGRGLEDFSEGELHLVGKGCEMRARDMVICVLDQVEIFDEQVTPPWPVAEQRLDFVCGGRVDLAAL